MDCIACNTRLNTGRWTTNHALKACPHCSEAHGKEHAYYPYPDHFGETPARVTANNRHGSQSYCVNCRAGHTPTLQGAVFCGGLATTDVPPP